MLKRYGFIWILFLVIGIDVSGQLPIPVSIQFIRNKTETLPNKIVNIPFFIKNSSESPISASVNIELPERWSLITKSETAVIKPGEQKFTVASIQIPSAYPVGNYTVTVSVLNSVSGEKISFSKTDIKVNEIEKISLQLIESPEHVLAGETYKGRFLLQNQGNTKKNIFIETTNCIVEGTPEISLNPGESKEISVTMQTTEDLINTQRVFCTVRALLSGEVQESVFRPVIIFPVKNTGRDLYFRYPVNASASYLATNQDEVYQSVWQFELSGNGSLDPQGKHQLEFLARGPNSSNLSFLGLYDQYYISYANKNLELSVGQKSYSFTPLTESSRFGFGVESKVIFNSGLGFGFTYVNPRFYEGIKNEMAFHSHYEKDRNNKVGVYYVLKKNEGVEDEISLVSLNTSFQPWERTTIEVEASRGFFGEIADNAFRGNINTQFWIFRAAGNYFYTGKNYPGYYSNSTFYSGSFSAQLTSKINFGVYARQDFTNAQLDTFFVTAPYSRSLQTFLNYNIASRTYLKIYLREYERKDRLALDKFHYKTRSVNSQFRQKLNRFEYSLLGEYGQTTNFLNDQTQNTYRGTTNLGFRFNSNNAIRIFGSYSNVNSFVSGEQRNVTAGLSVSSQLFKNFKANFYLQNAYDIEDYYRNRNLMQLNLNYNFLRNHELSFRSYYTLFRRETKDPEFFLSATYSYKLGVPVKQVIKAGDVKGRVTNDEGEPVEEVVLHLYNKTTITNNNGEYLFKTIPPGQHLLSIEQSGFEINEIPNIPMPVQVDVIEDRETTLNFRITEGAKLTGKFKLTETDGAPVKNSTTIPGNIIIELKSDFEQFRITSNEDGSFSFPLVIPGEWTFRIYENSIPEGFEMDKKLYRFDFNPGENIDLQIDVKRKERKIIFKSQNISLSNKEKDQLQPMKLKLRSSDKEKTDELDEGLIYSVQVGAFTRKVNPESSFFKGETFDFEKQINNFYKYFIGRFSSLDKAIEERKRLEKKFRGAFVVGIKNGRVIDINER
jgi:hypothetical protein